MRLVSVDRITIVLLSTISLSLQRTPAGPEVLNRGLRDETRNDYRAAKREEERCWPLLRHRSTGVGARLPPRHECRDRLLGLGERDWSYQPDDRVVGPRARHV